MSQEALGHPVSRADGPGAQERQCVWAWPGPVWASPGPGALAGAGSSRGTREWPGKSRRPEGRPPQGSTEPLGEKKVTWSAPSSGHRFLPSHRKHLLMPPGPGTCSAVGPRLPLLPSEGAAGPPGPGEQRPAEHAPRCPSEHGALGTRRMAWVVPVNCVPDEPSPGDGPAGCLQATPQCPRGRARGSPGPNPTPCLHLHGPAGTCGAFPQPCRLPRRHTSDGTTSRPGHRSAPARCAFPVQVTTGGHGGSRR